MTEALKLFILAGEPSGDRIAADLVRGLRGRADVELTGVGGPELEAEGLRPLFPMSELSVMGWADVLPRLPKLLARAQQTAYAILARRPDVVVLVDAQEFSRAVARRVRASAPEMPLILYVAPAVWAWKPKRALTIKPLFDEVLAVLPFEPAVMQRIGGPPTTYAGHPSLTSMTLRDALPRRGPLLLLPGSRNGELRRHLPLMQGLARQFAGHPAVSRLVLPTLARLQPRLVEATRDWPGSVEVVSGAEARAAAFADAIAAVAVTGTVTLELAMAGVPMVTTYVADLLQGANWLRYRTKYAALPNAILDRPLVPEVLGLGVRAEAISTALGALLDGPAGEAQFAGFREMRGLMQNGTPEAPRQDPALRVLAHARSYRSAIGT
jgi:lipid-A-disaccharide synthase